MDLQKYFDESLFTDGKIVSNDGRIFPVHRFLIAAQSPNAKDAFLQSKTISIPCDGTTADLLLRFCYAREQKTFFDELPIGSELVVHAACVRFSMTTALDVLCNATLTKFVNARKTYEAVLRFLDFLELLPIHSHFARQSTILCAKFLPTLIEAFPEKWDDEKLRRLDARILPNRSRWLMEGPKNRPKFVAVPACEWSDSSFGVSAWARYAFHQNSHVLIWKFRPISERLPSKEEAEKESIAVKTAAGWESYSLPMEEETGNDDGESLRLNVHGIRWTTDDPRRFSFRILDDFLFVLDMRNGTLVAIVDLIRQILTPFGTGSSLPSPRLPEDAHPSEFQRVQCGGWIVDQATQTIFVACGRVLLASTYEHGEQSDFRVVRDDLCPGDSKLFFASDGTIRVAALEKTKFGYLFHGGDGECIPICSIKSVATRWEYSPDLKQCAIFFTHRHLFLFDLTTSRPIRIATFDDARIRIPWFASPVVEKVKDESECETIDSIAECLLRE